MADREQRVRQRAYELWQAEGRPEGRAEQHWEQACRELDALQQPAADVGETKGIVADESGAQFGNELATASGQQSQQQQPTRARKKR